MGTMLPSAAVEVEESPIFNTSLGTAVTDFQRYDDVSSEYYNKSSGAVLTAGVPTGFASDVNNIYTLLAGTSEDYDYKTEILNADGSVTTNYYKIVLNVGNVGTSEHITWTQAEAAGANTVAITLPNNEVVYMEYSYSAPADYTGTSKRVTSPNSSNTSKMVFSGINTSTSYTGSNSTGSARGSFYGTDDTKTGTDQSDIFTSTNVEDSRSYKANARSTVSASTSISENANASASVSKDLYGGALSNTSSTAVDITADFKDNNASQSVTGGTARGGSLTVYGGDATATGGNASAKTDYNIPYFSNYLSSRSIDTSATATTYASATTSAKASANASTSASSYTYGGALANQSGAKLGNINGNFINNYAYSRAKGGSAYGGTATAYGGTAISTPGNATASSSANATFGDDGTCNTLTNATSEATATSTATAEAEADSDARAYAYGGAISNQGTMGNINGDFTNNHVEAVGERGYVSSGSATAVAGSASAERGSSSASSTSSANFVAACTKCDDPPMSTSASVSVSGYSDSNSKNSDSSSDISDTHPSHMWLTESGTWAGIGQYKLTSQASANATSRVTESATKTTSHSTSNTAYAYAYGGAIYNASARTIGTITGNFTGNYATATAYSSSDATGGAIDNRGTIGKITGDFISNYVNASRSTYGGAVYNSGTMEGFKGNFTNNYIKTGSAYGGAIYSTGTIKSIDEGSVFSGNYVASSTPRGGAIYNSGSGFGDINAEFLSNYTQATGTTYGGAIYNSGKINSITGAFFNNYAATTNSTAYGGAIYNSSTITNGINDVVFSGNYASARIDTVAGGAIYNSSSATLAISGSFIKNHTESSGSASSYGGAIYNTTGTLNINADFNGNWATSKTGLTSGGAIHGRVNNITDSSFTDNYVTGTSSAFGGAIYNPTTSNDIISAITNSTFSGNYAESTAGNAYGGALYGGYRIDTVSDTNFLNNYAKTAGASAAAFGGGVYNNYTFGYTALNNLKFSGNYAEAARNAYGGGLYNSKTVSKIIADSIFSDNYVKSTGSSGNAQGGAIFNSSSMSAGISGSSFTGNFAVRTANSGNAMGGAIYNSSTFGAITDSQFTGNYVSATTGSAQGGAICNNSSTSGAITNSQFTGNYASATTGNAQGGAIWTLYNSMTSGNASTPLTFTGNYVDSVSGSAYGGALYYGHTAALTLTNASFKNNYAHTTSGTALGGAIWTNYNTTILANSGLISEFSGNYVQTATGDKVYDAIYMGNSSYKALTLNANGGKILFNDNLNGVSGWTLTMTGGSTDASLISLFGQVKNATTASLATTHLTFGENTFNSAGLTFNANSGYIELKDSLFKTYNFNKIAGKTAACWNIDVDLANKKSDMIKTNEKSSGYVYINDVNTEGIPEQDGTIKVQILDTQASGLQLSLNSSLTTEKQLNQVKDSHCDNMTADVAWNGKFDTIEDTWTTYGKLGLATTVTLNDSIEYTVSTRKTASSSKKAGDTLKLWNEYQFNTDEKNFNFDAANNIYNAEDNIGTSVGSTLNINGVSAGDSAKSTINLNGHTGFIVNDSITLNLKDVQFTNAVNSEGSVLDVQTGGVANINGVIMASENATAPISNDGTLNFSGNKSTLKAPIAGNGTMNVNSTVAFYEGLAQTGSDNAITQDLVQVNNGGNLLVYNNGKINADLVINEGGTVQATAATFTQDVTNDGQLSINGSGTLADSVNGSGVTTVLNNATVTNNGGINQSVVIQAGSTLTNNASLGADEGLINNAGTLNTNAENLKGNVANSNNLYLTGGTLNKLVSGDGLTTITGNATNAGGINQSVKVNEGITLTNASTLGAEGSVITNEGTINTVATNIKGSVTNNNDLTLTGGMLEQVVSGSGTTNVTGNVEAGSLISQAIAISTASSLTASASNVGGDVTNAGTLTLNNGTLNKTVTGDGTTKVTGSVTANSTISQAITVETSGSLTANGDNVNGDVSNTGSLNLTGGTLNKVVNGSGTTTITGNSTNAGGINQAVIVNEGVILTNNSALGSDSTLITNAGTINTSAENIKGNVANSNNLNLIGGTLNKLVSGDGLTTITGNATNAGGINQSVKINEGVTLTNTSTLGAEGSVITNEGTINTVATNIKGSVTNNNDLTLTGGMLEQVVSGSGTTNVTGNVEANSSINQDIAISTSGNLTTNASNVGGNVSNAGNLTLQDGTLSKDVSGDGTTNIDGTVTSNALIDQDISILASGNLISNAGNIGGEVSNSGDLTLNAGTLNETVTGDGTTNIVGSVTGNALISQEISISESGIFTSNADYIGGNVTNSNELNITGGTLNNSITGKGSTVIVGNSTNAGEISQSVTVNEGVVLTNNASLGSSDGIITNKGTINTNAANIKGNVTNSNNLNLTGGTLNKVVSGDGLTTISGNTTNAGGINQSVTVNEGVTLTNTASLGSSDGIITNDGIITINATNILGSVANNNDLILTGGTLVQDISGSGITNVTGNVTNNAVIGQKIAITTSGNLISNAGNIGGEVSNEGDLHLSGGTLNKVVSGDGLTTITGNTTNAAGINQSVTIQGGVILTNNATLGSTTGVITNYGLVSTDATNILGNVVNDNNLTLQTGILSVDVSGGGTTNITGTVINKGIISQDVHIATTGDMDNKNNIGNVVNDGTLTSSANTLLGTIENNGILNLSGTLAKVIYGNGTTNVSSNLTLNDGTDIKGTLNVSNNALISSSTDPDATYSLGALTGNGDMNISAGHLTIVNNAEIHDFINNGISEIKGTLTNTGDISNLNSLTVNGKVTAGNVINANNSTLTFKGGADVNDFTNDGDVYITGNLTANDILNNENTVFNVTGNVNAANITNLGDMDILGNVVVSNIVRNVGTLEVQGTLTAAEVNNTGDLVVHNGSTVSVEGNLITSENIVTSGILQVVGNVDANDLTNKGVLTVGKGIDVNGLYNEASGKIAVSGDFIVNGVLEGNTDGYGLINDGNIEAANNLIVNSNLKNNSIINVEENLTTTGNLLNDGKLTVKGNVETQDLTNNQVGIITGTLSAGDISNSNSLTVSGKVSANDVNNTLGAALTFENGADIQDFTNEGITRITGDLNTNEILNKNDISVQGNVTSTANVVNERKLTVTENLSVSKDITNKDQLQVEKDLSAIGNIDNDGTLIVNGNITGNNVSNNNVATVAGNLTSKGTLTNTDGTLTVSGHVSSQDLTNTNGTVVFRKGAEVQNILNSENSSIEGIGELLANGVTNNGNIQLDGDLNVTEDIINTGIMNISGSVSSKNISNENQVEITGSLLAQGDITNANRLIVEGNLTSQNITNNADSILVIKNGAEVRNLSNSGTTEVTGDLIANEVENNNELTVIGNLTSKGNVTNTSSLTVDGAVKAKDLNNALDSKLTFNNGAALRDFTNEGSAKINGNVTLNELQNKKELVVTNALTSLATINNSGNLKVDGLVTAQDIDNSSILNFNNGANFNSFTNFQLANITNGLAGDTISNTGILNISSGNVNINTINNTSQININNKADVTLVSSISGNGGHVNITDSQFSTNGNIQNQNVTVKTSIVNLGDNGNIFNSSSLNISGSTVNTIDGKFTNYVIDELHSSEDTKYNIDIILNSEEQKADTFTLANGGTGKIFISSINLGENISNDIEDNTKYRLQIIKSSSPDAPQLDFDGSKVLNQASANMSSDMIMANEFGLYTTDTLNDSLEIRGLMDTFGEWIDYVTSEDKSFTFVDNRTYVLTRDIVKFNGNNSVIKGADNVFDMNNKLFLQEVQENQKITFNNINLINGNGITTNNGLLTLDNVTAEKDFTNNNRLELKNNIAIGNLVNNADLTHNGDKLYVKDFTNSGKAVISSAQTVSKNIVNDGSVEITGNLTSANIVNNESADFIIAGNVISEDLTNHGNLKVSGSAGSTSNITNTNELSVEKDMLVQGDLSNSGNLSVGGELKTGGDITNAGKAIISGHVTSKNITNTSESELVFNKGVDLYDMLNDGLMTVSGDVTANNVVNNKDIDIVGNLAVASDITNTSSLNVTKNVVSKNLDNSSNIVIGGDLSTSGNVNNTKTMIVSGRLSTNSLNNDSILTVNKGLRAKDFSNNASADITGDTNVDSITNTGSLNIDGDVLVSKITNDDSFNVNGNLKANEINNNSAFSVNNSTFIAGKITSKDSGDLAISNSTFTALDALEKQNISATNSTINVSDSYSFVNNSLSMKNSTMNMGGLSLNPVHINTLNMTGSTINIPSVYVDFTNNTMGKLTANSVTVDQNSVINLNNFININTPDKETRLVKINFADRSFSHNVSYNGRDILDTPIYRYGVSYEPDDGNMVFVRGGRYNPSTGKIDGFNPSAQFNPTLLTPVIAAHTAANSTMNQTYNYVFQNSDNFMAYPLKDRLGVINRNKYAINGQLTGMEFSTNCPVFGMGTESSSWFKPYANFETIQYYNGPKVHTTTYGSLAGFDTSIKELRGGWARTYTGYIGYNGATQSFSGTHVTQNGGLLGSTITFYKGNFFNATTLSTGASVAETSSQYGHDDITMLIAGAANKTGYNFEFKEGRYIVQPNLLLSYTFVNTFDYTNAAGVRVDSSPLHSLQVSPGFKLMANMRNGWQPYLSVNMVMNFLDNSRVSADAIRLPEISTRPYVLYGIGMQKTFKDNFMAFGQTMFQSGGRHGVSITAGLRWSLGHDSKPEEKVHSDNNERCVNLQNGKSTKNTVYSSKTTNQGVRTVIKQMPSVSNKTATTKTVSQGVIKYVK